MNLNLKPIKNLIETNDCFDKLTPFEIDNGRLIADLSFGYDTYQIYSDNRGFLTLYCNSYESNFHYYYCESFKTSLDTLNLIIQDFYNGSILGFHSKRWWSFLPDWVVLSPKMIDQEFIELFDIEINHILNGIDCNKDLTKEEFQLVNEWSTLIHSKYENQIY